MSISYGILAAAFLLVVLLAAAVGLALGLWWGERGRRLDVMWWAELQRAPSKDELRAEVEPSAEGESEVRALERAEVESVYAGLVAELEREGRDVDRERVRQEALELVSQMHTEMGTG